MPKVAIIAVMSVNGVLSRKKEHSVDWSSSEDKGFFKQITLKMGVVIMGRKTFETLNYTPLPGRLNVVMSRKPWLYEKISSENLIITDMNPETLIDHIHKLGYDNIAVIGGPQIYSLFLEKGLVTDIFLTIEPLFLSGEVHFQFSKRDLSLKLSEIKKLSSNTILLHYTLENS
ncbi:hypothetical protein AT15_02770 [Kosmotoga arenicorallina S304]|uniref:dihydrofolate reductase n=1 Tax=Kosmotoga arenicorallina S304 TaxID=1453497 RepID=A0A182C7U5_9BACT|nr:dihydrofolate reductase family protein [Kosmotoga arenicorallina]OAA31766.1 hypothetical protein AT15_02770 [Kosmotoga arenicorallina S304]